MPTQKVAPVFMQYRRVTYQTNQLEAREAANRIVSLTYRGCSYAKTI